MGLYVSQEFMSPLKSFLYQSWHQNRAPNWSDNNLAHIELYCFFHGTRCYYFDVVCTSSINVKYHIASITTSCSNLVSQSFQTLGYTTFSRPHYLKMIMPSDLLKTALVRIKFFCLFQETWSWDHDVKIVGQINESYSMATLRLNLVE